jgi:hypothetical protein
VTPVRDPLDRKGKTKENNNNKMNEYKLKKNEYEGIKGLQFFWTFK